MWGAAAAAHLLGPGLGGVGAAAELRGEEPGVVLGHGAGAVELVRHTEPGDLLARGPVPVPAYPVPVPALPGQAQPRALVPGHRLALVEVPVEGGG